MLFRSEIANVAQGHLMDADLAVSALNDVLAVDAHHMGALTVLSRLYEQSGEWQQCATTLGQAIGHGEAGPARAEAWRRLGLIQLERLDQAAEARSSLQQALDEGQDLLALEALLRLARESSDEGEELRLLELQASLTPPDRKSTRLNSVTL